MMNKSLRFNPKYQKIIDALLYIAIKRPGTDHYAASKYIYMADERHFNMYGRPITFDSHAAMPWGPVALKAYELLKQEAPVMRAAQITELPFETSRVEQIIYLGRPKREVDISLFSETDIEVIDSILEDYGHLDMPSLHDLTKEHPAYKQAWEHRASGSKQALMLYEDLLVTAKDKCDLIEDLAPIAHRI